MDSRSRPVPPTGKLQATLILVSAWRNTRLLGRQNNRRSQRIEEMTKSLRLAPPERQRLMITCKSRCVRISTCVQGDWKSASRRRQEGIRIDEHPPHLPAVHACHVEGRALREHRLSKCRACELKMLEVSIRLKWLAQVVPSVFCSNKDSVKESR